MILTAAASCELFGALFGTISPLTRDSSAWAASIIAVTRGG